ncbi:erythromycin esterase-like protein [Desulfobaculum xiamenense]|uniref:Erythromycin esterase-like protein n=1 Tax=Desulfobaculum xiamenense TaxID=995050 RepID=A0A846QW11_9BACT|nr:hypothetical protein [Desulfobaculum xiamenense]NJB68819.1 erythromycin esterase-like protein [Desulfobaculum xiamenense]
METRKDDVSVSDDIETLSREFEEFKLQKEAAEAQVKNLRNAEDPKNGVFYAQEIFHLQQDKLRLDTEMEIRRRRMNRLRMAEADNGFLF